MNLAYRHSGVPADWIFTDALYQGSAGDPAAILEEMNEVAELSRGQPADQGAHRRLHLQEPAWHQRLEADRRGRLPGLRVGGAKVSEMHCNFLINDRNASAEDIERLGETVRARVKAHSGSTLHWEIIRIGVPRDGRPTGEALAEALAQ